MLCEPAGRTSLLVVRLASVAAPVTRANVPIAGAPAQSTGVTGAGEASAQPRSCPPAPSKNSTLPASGPQFGVVPSVLQTAWAMESTLPAATTGVTVAVSVTEPPMTVPVNVDGTVLLVVAAVTVRGMVATA